MEESHENQKEIELQEEISVEFNAKEGLYIHNTFTTVYPEYILVVEPLLKETIIKDSEGETIEFEDYLDQKI